MKTTMRLVSATLLLLAAAGARADTGPDVLSSWSGSIPADGAIARDAGAAPSPLASWNGLIPAGADEATPPRAGEAGAAPARGGLQVLASWTGAIHVG